MTPEHLQRDQLIADAVRSLCIQTYSPDGSDLLADRPELAGLRQARDNALRAITGHPVTPADMPSSTREQAKPVWDRFDMLRWELLRKGPPA